VVESECEERGRMYLRRYGDNDNGDSLV